MTDEPKITVTGAREFHAAMTSAAAMTPAMRGRLLMRSMILMQREVRLRAGGGVRRAKPENWGTAGPLGTGTGDYKRRVTTWPPNPDTVGFVGTERKDALIHEEGGTITAKKKFLAIPLTPEARRVGSPRKFPGDLFPFFPKPFRGTAFLVAQKVGAVRNTKGGRITPHYLLKRSVQLRRRPAWGPAWEFAAPLIERAFEQGTADLLKTGTATNG